MHTAEAIATIKHLVEYVLPAFYRSEGEGLDMMLLPVWSQERGMMSLLVCSHVPPRWVSSPRVLSGPGGGV